jgi:hypothetical protein
MGLPILKVVQILDSAIVRIMCHSCLASFDWLKSLVLPDACPFCLGKHESAKSDTLVPGPTFPL